MENKRIAIVIGEEGKKNELLTDLKFRNHLVNNYINSRTLNNLYNVELELIDSLASLIRIELKQIE